MSKYYYKGISLHKYCLIHGLKHPRIFYKINNLLNYIDVKEEKMEDFLDIVINNKVDNIVYKDKKLKDFCKKYELDYFNIKIEIIKILLNNKDASNVVEEAISKLPNDIKKTCYLNGVSYSSFKYRMKIIENNPEFSALTFSEKIELVLKKEMEKSGSLKKICKENNVSYNTIKSRVGKMNKTKDFSFKSKKEIVEFAINNDEYFKQKNFFSKYKYKGESLAKYCKEHNLKYSCVVTRVIRMNKKTNLPLEEIIEIVLSTYRARSSTPYYYKGELLKDYCNKNGFHYEYLVAKINKLMKSESGNVEEIVDAVVTKYSHRKRGKHLKYIYKDVPFALYCKENNLDYNNLKASIRNKFFSEKYQGYSLEEITEIVVDKTLKNKERKEIKLLQEKMRIKQLEKDEVLKACQVLNLDIKSVLELNEKFKINQAINLIWYYSDIEINKKKSISKERIKQVVNIVKKIEKGNLNDIEIVDLTKVYKCRFFDTRNIMLERFEALILGSILKACSYYSMKLDDRMKEEFVSQAKMYFLLAIDNVVDLNYNGRIVNYLNKRVSGYMKAYVKDFNKEFSMVRLDSPLTENATLMDVIEDKKDYFEIEEEIDKEKFFSMLNNGEKKFMMFLYNENYSYQELSKIYNVSVDKIIKKEKELLSKIKNDETFIKSIKNMK